MAEKKYPGRIVCVNMQHMELDTTWRTFRQRSANTWPTFLGCEAHVDHFERFFKKTYNESKIQTSRCWRTYCITLREHIEFGTVSVQTV